MDLNQKEFRQGITALIKECDKNLNIEHRINLFTWELLEELEENKYNLFYNRYGDI